MMYRGQEINGAEARMMNYMRVAQSRGQRMNLTADTKYPDYRTCEELVRKGLLTKASEVCGVAFYEATNG